MAQALLSNITYVTGQLPGMSALAEPGGYRKMLTARAITSPRMTREPVACTVIASLAAGGPAASRRSG